MFSIKRNIILPIILSLITFTSFSQNLIVTLNNSTLETFPISSIRSIKFGSTSMILVENNGLAHTWEITDINNYSFENSLAISDHEDLIKETFTVFPNPATDIVNINYFSNKSVNIDIDILDVNGKELLKIYSGNQLGEKLYKWSPKAHGFSPGTYYCRIRTEGQVIVRSIQIQ